MKNHKQLNEMISNILQEPKNYTVYCELRAVLPDVSLESAQDYIQNIEPENKHLYTIVTSRNNPNYAENVNDALRAAKKISEKNNDTFVLSIEDGEWKAAYGSFYNHVDYIGANPAYCTCMAILKFMGKL
jgi:hypothetical protein